ncbi:MAG: MarR family transcriptional regulator [Flavobacteriaceae bacterium]|nr:MarR family transcriptional regulator [Flavobacteriaceae bacterium]
MDRTDGLGFHIDRTLKTVQLAYQQQFSDNNIGLTIEQWVLLDYIQKLSPGALQSDLSKLNFRNRATTSRVVKGLIRKGLVAKLRLENNQKQYILDLTSEGVKIWHLANQVVQKLRRLGKKDISSADFNVFLSVLEKVHENYKP